MRSLSGHRSADCASQCLRDLAGRGKGERWELANSRCIMCFELQTLSRVGVVLCGHVSHVACGLLDIVPKYSTGRKNNGPNYRVRI